MLKKITEARFVLFAMTAFQLLWLAGIWFTGASGNWQKLVPVGVLAALAYIALYVFRESFFENIGSGINWLAENQTSFLTLLAVVVAAVGIYYASVQQVWPFDEEENFYASKIIAAQGYKEFFAQYALENYLSNRHPPLIFMINGLAVSIFGDHLIVIRIVSVIFGYCMLVASYFLASALYGKRAAVLTVLNLLCFPLIIRESTAGLLDVQATFFFTLTLLLALRLAEKPTWGLGVALGFSLGLGLVTKYMVMFIIPLLIVFFVVRRNYRATVFPALLSFFIAGTLFLLWAWYGGQIGVRVPSVAGFSPSDLFTVKTLPAEAQEQDGDIIEEIAISPGFFITTESGRGFFLNSLITRLPSGFGAYSIPLILLGLFVAIRQRISSDLFVALWIGVVSILLILTLPDHRYFMVIFPALAMLGARWSHLLPSKDMGRLAWLLFVFQIGALYIFVDWSREAELFTGN